MKNGLLMAALAIGLTACGAKTDPLAASRRALARVANDPVEEPVASHISVRVSSQVLEELVFLAMEHGEDGNGAVTFPTPAGEATLRLSPGEVREAIQLADGACDGCVRVQGTVTGTVDAEIGPINMDTRAGVRTDIPVHVGARTVGRASEIVVTPRWDRDTVLDVQLLGLPLGGMGVNTNIARGLKQEFDGREFVVATLPAHGVVPIRGLSVQPGGVVNASLRVVGATEAPEPPRRLREGMWVGVSTPTVRAWFEAYLIRRSGKKWSATPSSITADDNRITAVVDVWRTKRKPKQRQYEISLSVAEQGGRWTVVEPTVQRIGRRGIDPVGGVIRGQITKRVQSIVDDDLLTGGELTIGSEQLLWQIDDVSADGDAIELLLDVRHP